MPRFLLRFFLALVCSLFFVLSASAATLTWDGGGSTENWSEGANWNTNSAPLSTDNVIFDATSTKNATIDASFQGTVLNFNMNAGYTGTITVARTFTISSTPTIAAGTLSLGSQAMNATCNCTFNFTGGTLNLGSGTFSHAGPWTQTSGTLTEGTSTVVLNGVSSATIDVNATETFYNLTINNSVGWNKSVANNDTLTVSNVLTLSEGELNQSTIPLAGSVVVLGSISHGANFDGGTAQVNLEGTATVSFVSGFMTGFKLNSAGATATGPSSGTLTFDNNITIAAGTFNAGAGAITLLSNRTFTHSGGVFNGGEGTVTFPNAVTISGGTFNAGTTTYFSCNGCTFTLSSGALVMGSGTLNVATHWTQTSGTFTEGTGTVNFYEGNGEKFIDVNATETFYNLTFNGTTGWLKTVSNSDTLTVSNILTLTESEVNQNTIPLAGSIVVLGSISHGAGFDGGTAQINLEGSGTVNFTSGRMTGFKLNGVGAVATGPSGGTLTFENHVTIADGTFNAGAGAISLLSPKIFTQSGGVFNGGDGAVTFAYTVTISGGTFNGGATTNFSCNSCTFTLSNGTFAPGSGTVNVATNWTQTSGIFTEGTSTVIFYEGNGDKAIDVNATETFYNLTFNITVGWTKSIANSDTLTVSNTLTLTEGTLNQTTIPLAGTLVVLGSISHGANFDGGTVQVNLEGSGTAAFVSGSMTGFKLNGASAVATGPSSGTTNFENHVTIADGTFNAGAGAITMDSLKIFTQSGGAFNGGAGTVTFPNAVTISGGTFNAGTTTNFSCNSCTFTFSNGTLAMGTGTLNVGTHWTQTSGIFTEGTGTVSFYLGNGDKTIDLNVSETFYNLNIGDLAAASTTKILANNDTLYVSNNLTLTDGLLSQTTIPATGTVSVSGNVTVASGYDGGTGKLVFTGGSTQNFNLTGATGGYNGDIAVNKSGGAVNLLSDLIMNANSQDLIIQEGTFDLSGFALTVTAAATETLIVETGGNLQLQGGETITADSSAYPQLDSGSTVTYDGTAGPYTLKSYNYHHLTINGAGAVFSRSTFLTLPGNLSIAAGTLSLNGNNLTITGTFGNEGTLRNQGYEILTFSAGNDTNSGTIEYVGDGDGQADVYGLRDITYFNLNVNFTDSQDSLNNVPFAPDTLTNGLTSYWKLDETTIGGAGSMIDSAGAYNGTPTGFASPEGPNVSVPSVMQFSDARSWDFSSDKIDTGFNVDQGSSSSPVLTIAAWVKPETTAGGNQQIASTDNSGFDWSVYQSGANWYMFTGATTYNTGKTATTGTWQHIVAVWKPGIGVEFYLNGAGVSSTSIDYDTSDNTFTIGSNPGFGEYFNGMIDDVRVYNRLLTAEEINFLKNGYNTSGLSGSPLANVTVNGSVSILGGDFDLPPNMSVAGNWTDTGAGTLTEDSSTVTFTGTSSINSNDAFENIVIDSAGTVTLGAALDLDGNLTLTSGALDVSDNNYGITVGGNWAKTGTFTQRSGTVTFDTAGTTSTISGNTTFYNLSCTTAGKPLTFTAGSTQTISGLLTLTGAEGNLIVLRSTVTDSAWNVNVAGTSSVDYVNVRDSNAGGGNAITHAVSPSRSVNVANNTNWSFNAAPTVASVTGVQAANGSSNVTITFIMDDPDDDNTLQAKVEYSLDGGSTWNDPTLSTTGSDTSASQGDPSVNNAVTYQVGQSGAFILSSGGANTVTTVWVGATDLLTSVNIANARIRITSYDGTVEGTAGSSANFILDRVSPGGLAGFNHGDFSSDRATLTWTAATDTNFNHYEIWSGETESQVIARTGSAVEWDNDNDATLTTASTITTTINNTDPRNKFFKIFAVDNYGNELTVATVYISGGQSSSSSSSSSSGGGGGGSSSGSGSSTSSDTSSSDEDETESEETTGSSSGEDNDSGSDAEDGDNGQAEEEEPVVEVDEESAGITWEEMGIEPPEHWSQGYVKYLEEQNNIIQVAVSEPTFMDILVGVFTTPDAMLDRARALEFLIVIAGYDIQVVDLNTRTMAFTDVPADHDRAAFIQFGFEQGLVNGYPDGTFQPEMTINRVEALKMATFFFEGEWTHPIYGDELLELYGLEENPFSDVDLNAWYAPYLINAYAKGVIHGYGDGTFGPGNYVTYAEFLKIATLMKNVEEAVELAEELQ